MDEICVVHFPIMIDTRQRVLIMGFHRDTVKMLSEYFVQRQYTYLFMYTVYILYIHTYIYMYIYMHVDTQNESNYVMCFVHIMRIPPHSWQADEREHEDPSWKFALFSEPKIW